MALIIVLLIVGLILAFRAGSSEQRHRQAKADAADTKTKFFRTQAAEWTTAATSAVAWLMLAICLALAVGVALSSV